MPDSPHLLALALSQLADIYGKIGSVGKLALETIQAAEKHIVVDEMAPQDLKKIEELKLSAKTQLR